MTVPVPAEFAEGTSNVFASRVTVRFEELRPAMRIGIVRTDGSRVVGHVERVHLGQVVGHGNSADGRRFAIRDGSAVDLRTIRDNGAEGHPVHILQDQVDQIVDFGSA